MNRATPPTFSWQSFWAAGEAGLKAGAESMLSGLLVAHGHLPLPSAVGVSRAAVSFGQDQLSQLLPRLLHPDPAAPTDQPVLVVAPFQHPACSPIYVLARVAGQTAPDPQQPGALPRWRLVSLEPGYVGTRALADEYARTERAAGVVRLDADDPYAQALGAQWIAETSAHPLRRYWIRPVDVWFVGPLGPNAWIGWRTVLTPRGALFATVARWADGQPTVVVGDVPAPWPSADAVAAAIQAAAPNRFDEPVRIAATPLLHPRLRYQLAWRTEGVRLKCVWRAAPPTLVESSPAVRPAQWRATTPPGLPLEEARPNWRISFTKSGLVFFWAPRDAHEVSVLGWRDAAGRWRAFSGTLDQAWTESARRGFFAQ